MSNDKIRLYGKRNSILEHLRTELERELGNLGLDVALEVITDPSEFVQENLTKIPSAKYQEQLVTFSEEIGSELFINELIQEIMKQQADRIITQVVVPIDFSESSKNAFFIGFRMAVKLNVGLTLIHVFTPVIVPAEGMLYMDPEIQEGVRNRFDRFVGELEAGISSSDRNSISISQQFRIGMVSQQLQDALREMKGPLVVMGTSGEGNRVKEWLGSISLWMVKNVESPVLLIPPSARKSQFNRILFACDHFGLYDDALAAIKHFSGNPEAQIDIIHVFDEGKRKKSVEHEVISNKREQQIKEVILFDGHFLESIQNYVKENSIDLIVMVRRTRGFWKELFHQSKTRKMAVYTEVPLLVLHDKEIELFEVVSEKEELV